MEMYLVQSKGGWVEPPVRREDLSKTDTIIAVFRNDLWFTAEEQFERFADWVRAKEGKVFCEYNAEELHAMYNDWFANYN